MIKRYGYIIFVFFFHLSYGQLPGFDLFQKGHPFTLDFEYQNGLIVVPIKYNNLLPLNFIFDTGAEHTILFDRTYNDLFELPYDQQVSVMGADLTKTILAQIVRNVPIKLKDNLSVKRDIIVLQEDQMKLDEITGVKLDGIIGGRFFNNLMVHIDFVKKKITFHHPEKFDHWNLKDYHFIEMIKYKHKPILKCPIKLNENTLIQARLLVDTGASLPLLIHHNLNRNIVLPENILTGNLGVGLGGQVQGYVSRAEYFSISELKINQPICFFQEYTNFYLDDQQIFRQGIIGTGILSRFDVYIDYLKEVIFLKPNKYYHRPFKYDRSGLILYCFGDKLNRFYVKEVIPDSPADIAGVKAGDELKRIGLFRHKHYSLEKLTNKLSGREGKKIRLVIDRNGEKIKVNFNLRELLKPIGKKP